MLELTIPSKSKEAIIKAKERKANKSSYNLMIGDLEEPGLSVTYRTLEIGSLGHYLSDAALCISHSFQLTKSETKQILQKASKIASVLVLLPADLPSPPLCEVNLRPRLSYLCTSSLYCYTRLSNICNEGISLFLFVQDSQVDQLYAG